MSDNAETLNGVTALFQIVDGVDAKALRSVMDELRQKLGDSAIVLASEHQGKAVRVSSVSESLHAQLTAGDLMKIVAQELGGRGGGRADMAEGGADSLAKIDAAFATAREWVNNATA